MITTIVQEPLVDRYTLEWHWDLQEHPEFDVLGHSRYVIGVDRSKPYNYFANLEHAVRYEMDQISTLLGYDELSNVLITDLDFPGVIGPLVPTLKLKYPEAKFYGIFHAGSWYPAPKRRGIFFG